MGYTNGFLSRVVVSQALIYTLAAYVPAVALGYGLYRVTEALANIPMRLTVANLGVRPAAGRRGRASSRRC